MRMRIKNPKQIYVPRLMDGGKVIVPGVAFDRDVLHMEVPERIGPDRDTYPISAAMYQDFSPPTLAELRHAFFDKNPDGSFISPEYRESVLSNKNLGEWTSTLLRGGKEAVERPERLFYDEKHGLWIAEGGDVMPLELPPEGWVLEYDRPTGFPSRTSENKKDAGNVFSDDASYFLYNPNGLKVVLRLFGSYYGPFHIYALCDPSARINPVGVRPSRFSSRSREPPEHIYRLYG